MCHRASLLVTLGLLLVLLSPAPAGTVPSASEIMPAPRETQNVHDSAGRVTLEVPKGWVVRSTTEPGGTPLLIARAPNGAHGEPMSVLVVEEELPVPITPAAFAQGIRQKINRRDLVVIREGPTQVGDLPAFSRAATWRLGAGAIVYGLENYLTSGTIAVMAIGLTANVPDRLRQDLPVLNGILNTIRITGVTEHRDTPQRLALVATPRRDLFEPRSGVQLQPGDQPTGLPVTGSGLSLPPLSSKLALPRPTSTLYSTVTVVGIITGGKPQAILRSGTQVLIVQRGDPTPWGRVRSISSTGVAVTSGRETRTLTFSGTIPP